MDTVPVNLSNKAIYEMRSGFSLSYATYRGVVDVEVVVYFDPHVRVVGDTDQRT